MAISAEIGPRLETFVDELVKNGRYGSKSEVIREGIRLVEEREAALARLSAKLDAGLADIAAGRTTPAEEVFDRIERKLISQIEEEDRRRRATKSDAA